MSYYGGIEGGTTGSRMIILDESGKQLGSSEGPHTNYWHLGMEKAAQRISQLAEDALAEAGLPKTTQLKSLGLALSGINTELNRQQIVEAVRQASPNIAGGLYACNDAVGTLVTVTDGDALVLIAGTGSICKLIRKNLSFVRIGGLGYILGDEGSAFWIAHRAIMRYIKTTEGLYHPQYDMKQLEKVICTHFQIQQHDEILAHFHENINKTFIAQLCRPLAEAARDGDLLCKDLFRKAGVHLGRHVAAGIRHANKEGLVSHKGIDVICCGSVFKSWDLLESGFRCGLKSRFIDDCPRGRICLRLLQKTAAIGSAILAAKLECNVDIPRPENTADILAEISLFEHDSLADAKPTRQ